MTLTEHLDLLIKEGECLTVEFKEKYTSKIDQDMVAFANTIGGKIILGVTDLGVVKGESLSNRMKAEIIDLAQKCDPSVHAKVYQSDKVVVIEVKEGSEKPYSCSSGAFKRLDAVTQKLKQKDLRIYFESSTSRSFEKRPCQDATLNDLSLKKVKDFCKTAGVKIAVTGKTLSNVMRSFSLVSENELNHAALLFFASRIDNFILHSQIQLLVFKDLFGVDIFDRKDVRGTLIEQFNEAEFFLKRHLSLGATIVGMKRIDEYEIPEVAWREAIANAIIHRDYRMSGTGIQVKLFPDRLEVINPGSLTEHVTVKNFSAFSNRRNEIIADMFARLKMVERAGTGIVRILSSTKSAGLKTPVFEDLGGFFRVTLYRPVINGYFTDKSHYDRPKSSPKSSLKSSPKSSLKSSLKSSPKSSPRGSPKSSLKTDQKIVALLLNNPRITVREMELILKISSRAIKKQLANLKEMGRIQRVGSDRTGHWEVISSLEK